MKKSMFVPDDLPEGKEENRALPWVFHGEEQKSMELKCIMRGFNDSNNPSDYKKARWSHPGFDDSQVDFPSVPEEKGEDNGVPYTIWTMKVTISAKDAGKKLITCEWQQGDFPLSTDFKFLIFRRHLDKHQEEETVLRSYSLGEPLDEKDMTKQIDDEIKRQICDHYSILSSCNVTRSGNEYEILIPVDVIDEASSSIIIVIIITVLFVVAIIALIAFKFKGKIHTHYEIVMSKISTPNTNTTYANK